MRRRGTLLRSMSRRAMVLNPCWVTLQSMATLLRMSTMNLSSTNSSLGVCPYFLAQTNSSRAVLDSEVSTALNLLPNIVSSASRRSSSSSAEDSMSLALVARRTKPPFPLSRTCWLLPRASQ